MRPLPIVALSLLLLPLIEIWLLIAVGSRIGALATFLLLILAGFVGVLLLRHQGLATLSKFQQRMQRGEHPAQALQEGAIIGLGALLLLIPGFFTDILGLLCILPPTRHLIIQYGFKAANVSGGSFYYRHTQHPRAGNAIEGEVVRRQDDA